MEETRMKEIIPCKICEQPHEVISHMSYTNNVDHDMVDFDIIQCSNPLCKWNIYLFLNQRIELEKLFARNLIEQYRYREAVISCLDFKRNLFYERQYNENHFDCVVKLWNMFHFKEEKKREEKACNIPMISYTKVNILTGLDFDL